MVILIIAKDLGGVPACENPLDPLPKKMPPDASGGCDGM